MHKHLFFLIGLLLPGWALAATPLTPKQQLGKQLFFDNRFSNPVGLSCASCHDPARGFSDPRTEQPVSAGAAKGMFTSRNAPSVMYLRDVPKLHIDKKEGIYIGGLLYDGRANTLEAQVAEPLLSKNEMALNNKQELQARLRKLGYADSFKRFYGKQTLATPALAFDQFAALLAAYERSSELNPYSSKYDLYLQGKLRLTKQEQRGRMIFEDEKKANCAACHPVDPQDDGTRPMFTDFSYDNLGVPRNPANPFYKTAKDINPAGKKFVDIGLGKTVNKKAEHGKFRVPTLRNIAITAPYMHNGVFNTLEEVVDFYNSRDVKTKWGKPEVAKNVNKDELGDLKLTKQEMKDLVVFMKTLTDGYQPK